MSSEDRDVEPVDVVAEMRPLILSVDGDGRVLEHRGGFGGFLGLDLDGLVGGSVFDFLDPASAERLTIYLIESIGETEEVVSLPMPFRMSVRDGDGRARPVDVIPTGRRHGPDAWRWTVVIVPLELSSSIVRPLDLEMAGASRDDVCAALCEELTNDATPFAGRWFLLDLEDPGGPRVRCARPDEDGAVASALGAELLGGGWRPWRDLPAGAVRGIEPADVPSAVREVMDERDWRRCVVAPVHVEGELAAVFVMLSRVPDGFDPTMLKRNVANRVEQLVRVTALVFGRWAEERRLRVAATTDPLTGLPNRQALFDALLSRADEGALLYLDVDDFKAVNDRYGHSVGDRVLCTLAGRIVDRCGSADTVARIGGDEFVVLLAGDVALGGDLGLRIVNEVGRDLGIDGGPEHVGVSVGLAGVGSVDEPLHEADRAMLLAKRRGRGRMERATSRRGDDGPIEVGRRTSG